MAVKQLFVRTAQGMDEFLNEVVLITGMKHRNLVNLKGCCLRENQRLLVYEYVNNYDVDQILLGMSSPHRAHAANTHSHFFVSRQKVHYLHLMACWKQFFVDEGNSDSRLLRHWLPFETKIFDIIWHVDHKKDQGRRW